MLLFRGRAQNGGTPLYYAAEDGHLEVVQLLLDKGADKDVKATSNVRAPYRQYSVSGAPRRRVRGWWLVRARGGANAAICFMSELASRCACKPPARAVLRPAASLAPHRRRLTRVAASCAGRLHAVVDGRVPRPPGGRAAASGARREQGDPVKGTCPLRRSAARAAAFGAVGLPLVCRRCAVRAEEGWAARTAASRAASSLVCIA
jgi:hypothetical protein